MHWPHIQGSRVTCKKTHKSRGKSPRSGFGFVLFLCFWKTVTRTNDIKARTSGEILKKGLQQSDWVWTVSVQEWKEDGDVLEQRTWSKLLYRTVKPKTSDSRDSPPPFSQGLSPLSPLLRGPADPILSITCTLFTPSHSYDDVITNRKSFSPLIFLVV